MWCLHTRPVMTSSADLRDSFQNKRPARWVSSVDGQIQQSDVTAVTPNLVRWACCCSRAPLTLSRKSAACPRASGTALRHLSRREYSRRNKPSSSSCVLVPPLPALFVNERLTSAAQLPVCGQTCEVRPYFRLYGKYTETTGRVIAILLQRVETSCFQSKMWVLNALNE